MANGFGTPTNCPATGRQSSLLLPTTDCQQVQDQLSDCFGELADPRGSLGFLHPFVSIVMIGLLATLGGAWGWDDIETYGVSHQRWLSSFLSLPFGIPTADTYRRVFERIPPPAFERSFNHWLSSLVTDLGVQVIPIDGKQLKGSYDRNQEQSALHMVSAWAARASFVSGASQSQWQE